MVVSVESQIGTLFPFHDTISPLRFSMATLYRWNLRRACLNKILIRRFRADLLDQAWPRQGWKGELKVEEAWNSIWKAKGGSKERMPPKDEEDTEEKTKDRVDSAWRYLGKAGKDRENRRRKIRGGRRKRHRAKGSWVERLELEWWSATSWEEIDEDRWWLRDERRNERKEEERSVGERARERRTLGVRTLPRREAIEATRIFHVITCNA